MNDSTQDFSGYYEGYEKNFPILVDHLPNGSFCELLLEKRRLCKSHG